MVGWVKACLYGRVGERPAYMVGWVKACLYGRVGEGLLIW